MKKDLFALKESEFQAYWSMFKNLKDSKNRLLPRYVRRAKLQYFVKGRVKEFKFKGKR